MVRMVCVCVCARMWMWMGFLCVLRFFFYFGFIFETGPLTGPVLNFCHLGSMTCYGNLFFFDGDIIVKGRHFIFCLKCTAPS